MERRVKKQQDPTSATNETKNIIFFHPDLGIGGAERLVIDAAVGLQNLGHRVTIFTSYRDTNHCFDEARDGTLDVRVRGGWLIPATILGRFKILCSILRQIHLLVAITWSGELAKLKPTAFFIDQLSAGIPFLRWFWEDQKILFYCHFPDLLLVQGRKSWYKRIWRIGFDWLEGWGIRGADRVVVNSGFTKGVVEDIWNGLGGERGIGVVYPCVDTNSKEKVEEGAKPLWKDKKVLLSINRFEQKKDVGLAIRAFADLDPKDREGARLVIAGMSKILCSSRSPLDEMLICTRRLRPPSPRECALPPLSRNPRHLSLPPACDNQDPRLSPFRSSFHLRPLSPFRPFISQVFPSQLRPSPHLHPLKRALWHRAFRSHASRRSGPGGEYRRPAGDSSRCGNWVVAGRGKGGAMDGCYEAGSDGDE